MISKQGKNKRGGFFLQYSAFSVAILNSNLLFPSYIQTLLSIYQFCSANCLLPMEAHVESQDSPFGICGGRVRRIFLTSTLLSELHIRLLSQQLCATSSTNTQDKSLTPLLGLSLLQGFRQVMEFFCVVKSSKRGES